MRVLSSTSSRAGLADYRTISFEGATKMNEFVDTTVRLDGNQLDDMLKMILEGHLPEDSFFNLLLDSYAMRQMKQSPTMLEDRQQRMHFCRRVNESAYSAIIKATGFYWLGMLALKANDYETALFYMDAALTEEERNQHNWHADPTPTIRFFLLQGEETRQAAKESTAQAEAKVVRIISSYNDLSDRNGLPPLTLDEIRNKFLEPAIYVHREWRTAATSFITFNLEWDYRNELHDLRPNGGTAEPFLMHLSKGCTLFETLLRFQMSDAEAKEYSSLGGKLFLLKDRLGFKFDSDAKGKVFRLSDVLQDLDKNEPTTVIAMQITLKLRNAILHDLGTETGLTKSQYQRLYELVAFSCLHAFSKLFPQQTST